MTKEEGAKEAAHSKPKTVSLTHRVIRFAEEMMREKGFDNFSAYIADLIRRDQERSAPSQKLRENVGASSASEAISAGASDLINARGREKKTVRALRRDPKSQRGSKQ